MKNLLTLALALAMLETGLYGWQEKPQSSQLAAQESGPLQTLVMWHGVLARSIAFTHDAIWVTRCDQSECGVTRMDPSSHKAVITIRTSESPYGIVADDAGVWASIPKENSVIRIDPATNVIVARIPTGKTPTDLAAGGGAIWVANANNKSVSRIDPQSNAVIATIAVGGFPGSIAIGHGAVWVANGEGCWGCSYGTISRIEPGTNKVVQTLKTWKYGTEVHPSYLLAQEGSVWAIAGEHVLRIDPESNKIVKWIKIPSRKLFSLPENLGRTPLHGLAIIADGLWVADSSEQSLWKIDIHTDRVTPDPVRVGFPIQILGQGGDKEGSLWVSNAAEGSTLLVRP
jgi:YVTN family beta-propeller protein